MRPTRWATAGLLAMVIGGCNDNDAPSSTDRLATTAPPASLTQPALPRLPSAQTLDLQANHPNGTVLRVTKASFHDDHIQVGATVTNGNARDVVLDQYETLLRDDQGVAYRLSPPTSNPKLTVSAGATVNFNLVFLGRVSPKATALTLVTNDRISETTSQFATAPTFRLSPIPVQR